jgi:hypothetical protein
MINIDRYGLYQAPMRISGDLFYVREDLASAFSSVYHYWKIVFGACKLDILKDLQDSTFSEHSTHRKTL